MTKAKNVTPFTTSQVNLALEAIANEAPVGHKAEQFYFHECSARVAQNHGCKPGQPECIVGVLIKRLGIPQAPSASGYGQIANVHHYTQYFTPEAVNRLMTVQNRQDQGETWKRAIR